MSSKYMFLIAAVVGLGATSACAGQTVQLQHQSHHQSQKNTVVNQAQAFTAPVGPQASRVYIDPATGRRGTPPQGVVLAPAATAPLARAIVSPQVIDHGPVRGQSIDTRGLYQSAIAHLDQDGNVTTNCKPSDAQHNHVTGEMK